MIKAVLSRRVNQRIGRALHTYNMLKEGDRLLVAVSGGIDSLVLAWVLAFWRHKAPIDYEMVCVHLDMAPENGAPGVASRAVAVQLARLALTAELIPATWRPPAASEAAPSDTDTDKDICFICARNRRNQLFELAREYNCNKVALGHHRDDIIETFFLNLLYGGNISTMVPRQDLFAGRLAIIRPLAFLEKAEITGIGGQLGLEPVRTPCPASGQTKRQVVREFIQEVEQKFPGAGPRIFAALGNVRTEYLLKAEGSTGARRKRPGATHG